LESLTLVFQEYAERGLENTKIGSKLLSISKEDLDKIEIMFIILKKIILGLNISNNTFNKSEAK
jgi:hypothetical protein